MLLRTLLLLSLSSLGYAIDLTTVADGKTDASAALQALIDSGAGRIDLPKGRYLLRPSRNSGLAGRFSKPGVVPLDHGSEDDRRVPKCVPGGWKRGRR